jgi:hypothetical protein
MNLQEATVKVKIFTNNGNSQEHETELNQWLEKNNRIDIISINQSCSVEEGANASIYIWYKE